MGQLALPSFMGGPEDKAKVVDAYTTVSPELRNNLTSKVSSFTSGLSGIFDKAVGITKGVGEKLRQGAVDLPTAKRRIENALKGSRSDIVSLSTTAEKLIMGELTGTDTNTNYVKTVTDVARGVQLITTDGKQVIQNFKDGNYGQLSAMVGFMSDLTGNPLLKVFDIGAEAAILRGVVEEVSAWGIPSLVDQIMVDRDDKTKYAVIKRSAESISYNSSLSVLESFAGVMSSWPMITNPADPNGPLIPDPNFTPTNIGANALTAATPDFAAKYIANFVFDAGVTPDQYPSVLARLVTLMDKLKPDWYYTRRNNKQVWNLGVLRGASENATTLFLSSPAYRDAMLTAPFYDVTAPQSLLQSQYPLIAL